LGVDLDLTRLDLTRLDLTRLDLTTPDHRARSSRGAAQTVKTASGQTRAQRAQLVQAFASVSRTG
jgi:hypothetical protein